MKRSFVLVALVAVLLTVTALTASAGFTWCMSDPNVKLPDGGVFHLWVGVTEENRDTNFTLTIWAPAGSTVVGNSGRVDMTVVLLVGEEGQVSAQADAAFDVLLDAKYYGDNLGAFIGSGVWDY